MNYINLEKFIEWIRFQREGCVEKFKQWIDEYGDADFKVQLVRVNNSLELGKEQYKDVMAVSRFLYKKTGVAYPSHSIDFLFHPSLEDFELLESLGLAGRLSFEDIPEIGFNYAYIDGAPGLYSIDQDQLHNNAAIEFQSKELNFYAMISGRLSRNHILYLIDYWRVDEKFNWLYKVKELRDSYQISKPVSDLLMKSISCWFNSDGVEIECSSCGAWVDTCDYEFNNRATYKDMLNKYKSVCEQQGVCIPCATQTENSLQEEKSQYLNEFLETLRKDRSCFKLEDLNFEQLVRLLALYNHYGSEDFSVILSEGNRAEPVAPNQSYDEFVEKLMFKGQSLLSYNYRDAGNFIVEENDEGLEIFVTTEASFLVNYDESTYFDDTSFYRALSELVYRKEFVVERKYEAFEFAKKLMLNMLLEYLENRLQAYPLIFNPGKKTKEVLYAALENYSVSQVYRFIWNAVKEAAASSQKLGISYRQAVNTIPGTIGRSSEFYISNDWENKPYKRNYELPQTTLERVAFEPILPGDAFFDTSLKQLRVVLGID